MTGNWDKISNIVTGLRGLTTIGVSDIIGSGIGVIFWFYMAALLGAQHYGEIAYLISIASIASTISLLGTENVISVYVPKKVRLESTIYLLTIMIGIISALVLFFMFSEIGISVYVLGIIIVGLGGAEILAKRSYNSYAKYLITQKILMTVLAIGLYHIMGVNGVILGLGLSFFPYLIRIYKGFRETKIDFALLKPRRNFMINSYILNLSGTFTGSIDKLIILPLVGFVLLGNYHLGIQFISLLSIIPAIVYKYVLPRDAGGLSNKKLKQATVILSIGLTVIGIILSPIIIPIMFPEYKEAIEIIQIMSISVIPSTINLMYVSKFLATEKNRIVLISSGIHIAILILFILVLGEIYGINGIAFALVLAISIESIYYYIISKILWKNGDYTS